MLIAGPIFFLLAAFALALAPSLSSVDSALKNLAGQAILLQADVGFAILSDLLVIPAALALYFALKGVNRNAMLVASGFLGLFAVLDLSVSIPNLPPMIALSQNYLSATTSAQQVADTASMSNLFSTLSLVLPICAFLIPSIGSLTASLVLLRGIFGRLVAYVGLAASAAGIAVALGLVLPALTYVNLVYLPLFGAWFVLVGSKLYRLARQ